MARLPVCLLALASLCFGAPADPRAKDFALTSIRRDITVQLDNPGEASHLQGNWNGGNCAFTTFDQPRGIYGAAISDRNWYNAGNCGACLNVRGPNGKEITAMVVDKCPGCGDNFLNLFAEGYQQLIPSSGFTDKIKVNWDVVSCGFNAPLAIQNKEGVSQFWFSVQIQAANWPVDAVYVSTDDGKTWENTVSKDYNFFERQDGGGFGTSTVALKITCVKGAAVYIRYFQIQDRKKQWAEANC
ncbi:hypothetical protein EJ08DRAFT_712199 [Tothia fuscella]|uniref:Expansin-like EG45 domain-containing protein n=1 Tax=Tothia fuscella TaxID=1048955 RepID=A0A9P4TZW6_9PEZI|nr:hypothetical protein EJ08DRAFT_712199 [Tothia fuscella]